MQGSISANQMQQFKSANTPFEKNHFISLNQTDNLKLLQHFQQQSLIFERICTCSNNSSEVEDELKKRRQMNGKYNIMLYDYEFNQNEAKTFKIFYEAYVKGLNKEFITHLKYNQRWRDKELINTIKSILKGLKEIHDLEIVHGDLRMSNIVLTEQGDVKLADQYCLNFEKINSCSYYKKDLNLLESTHSFLPPESMKLLKNNHQFKDKQVYEEIVTKSGDLWALGIIVLEMALLENVHHRLYDYKNFEIKVQFLKQKIIKLKSILPKKSSIITLIDILLNENPEQRLFAYDHLDQILLNKQVSFKDQFFDLQHIQSNDLQNIRSQISESNSLKNINLMSSNNEQNSTFLCEEDIFEKVHAKEKDLNDQENKLQNQKEKIKIEEVKESSKSTIPATFEQLQTQQKDINLMLNKQEIQYEICQILQTQDTKKQNKFSEELNDNSLSFVLQTEEKENNRFNKSNSKLKVKNCGQYNFNDCFSEGSTYSSENLNKQQFEGQQDQQRHQELNKRSINQLLEKNDIYCQHINQLPNKQYEYKQNLTQQQQQKPNQNQVFIEPFKENINQQNQKEPEPKGILLLSNLDIHTLQYLMNSNNIRSQNISQNDFEKDFQLSADKDDETFDHNLLHTPHQILKLKSINEISPYKKHEQQLESSIDEKFERLDKLCDKTLQKSIENRQKLEQITSNLKKNQENNKNKINEESNSLEKLNSFKSDKCVHNCKFLRQLNQLASQLQLSSSSSSSVSSQHSCSSSFLSQNGSNFKDEKSLTSSNLQLFEQLKNLFFLNKSENSPNDFKILVHYGKLALDYLFEYHFHPEKKLNNQNIEKKNKQLSNHIFNQLFNEEDKNTSLSFKIQQQKVQQHIKNWNMQSQQSNNSNSNIIRKFYKQSIENDIIPVSQSLQFSPFLSNSNLFQEDVNYDSYLNQMFNTSRQASKPQNLNQISIPFEQQNLLSDIQQQNLYY